MTKIRPHKKRSERKKREIGERSEGWRSAGTLDNLFEQVGQTLK